MQDFRFAFSQPSKSTGLASAVVLSLALSLAVGHPLGAEPASPGDAAIIEAVVAAHHRLNEASNRLDTDAFFANIVDSDESRIVQDGILFKTRAEAMAAVRQGSQGVASLDRRFEEPRVIVLAPDVALLTATGTSRVTLTDGRMFSHRFAVSLVFVLRGGRWLLLHGHYSLPNPSP